MPQARGALVRLLKQTEVVYRTAPAAAAIVMPATSWGVQRDARRQENASFNQSPLREKSDAGDPIVAGPFASILDLRTVGHWLKDLFGAPLTGKAVVTQPVNVTGVTIHYASADCTIGAGTLTWTIAGTALTWMPQGGAAGAPVNVGAGGNFTLQGGGGGKSIRISVIAGALPVGNQNDANISVHATMKSHTFPFNTLLRPSSLFEAQHSDLVKFYRVFGGVLGEFSWDVLNNDQNVAGNITAAVETEEVAAFDGAPTALAAVRACSGKGRVNDGSAGLGTVVGGTISVNNNLAGYECGDGLEGYGFIDNGELAMGGSIRTVFDSAGAYALARAGTSTRLRLESGAVVGADAFKLVVDSPHVELTESAPPKEGKSGLFVENAWRVHKGLYVPEVYLVNDVAAY